MDPIFTLLVQRVIRAHSRASIEVMTYEELLELALALGIWLEATVRRVEPRARTDGPAS